MIRIWHEGLIYKIQSTGISGTLLKLIKSFLNGRLQRVLLIGQASSLSLPRVPQGSFLGLLFLLIYLDLGNNLSSTEKLFADDTSFVHQIDLSLNQLMMTEKKSNIGPISGKCILILICLKKLTK